MVTQAKIQPIINTAINRKLDLKDHLYVFARVNTRNFKLHRQEASIGNWIPITNTGGKRYFVELPLKEDENTWVELIDDLYCLITAYFITDFQPRDLVDFKILTDHKNSKLARQAIKVFGFSDFVEFPSIQDITSEDLFFSGRVNDFLSIDPTDKWESNEDYPWEELLTHYKFFHKNKKLLRPFMLIRESFMNINQTLSNYTYAKETELLIGIILLVAALENLFLKNDKEEITFKFSLVASILYEKNVTQEDFDNIPQVINNTKLTFVQAKELFKILYNIRSDMAHGSLKTILKAGDKHWGKMAKLFNISFSKTQDFSIRVHNYALIMKFLQKHIALLLKNSLGDLAKSSQEIIDYLEVKKEESEIKL